MIFLISFWILYTPISRSPILLRESRRLLRSKSLTLFRHLYILEDISMKLRLWLAFLHLSKRSLPNYRSNNPTDAFKLSDIFFIKVLISISLIYYLNRPLDFTISINNRPKKTIFEIREANVIIEFCCKIFRRKTWFAMKFYFINLLSLRERSLFIIVN